MAVIKFNLNWAIAYRNLLFIIFNYVEILKLLEAWDLPSDYVFKEEVFAIQNKQNSRNEYIYKKTSPSTNKARRRKFLPNLFPLSTGFITLWESLFTLALVAAELIDSRIFRIVFSLDAQKSEGKEKQYLIYMTIIVSSSSCSLRGFSVASEKKRNPVQYVHFRWHVGGKSSVRWKICEGECDVGKFEV